LATSHAIIAVAHLNLITKIALMCAKPGRPKGPDKVVFKKRLTKEEAKMVSDFVRGINMPGYEPAGDYDPKKMAESLVSSIPANPSPAINQVVYEDALAEIKGLKLDLKRISDQAVEESTALGIARDEIAELKRKVEACARATDNQKAQWCIKEYERIKAWAAKLGNEFTQ